MEDAKLDIASLINCVPQGAVLDGYFSVCPPVTCLVNSRTLVSADDCII